MHKLRQHLTINLPTLPDQPVWIHACSVGEVASVEPLVNALLARNVPVHLTVVTATGMDHARRLFADRISASFLPWDVPGLMQRFVARLRPRLLLLTETEFWPGLLNACHHKAVPVFSINTRISDRSFPRYRATKWLWRRWLRHVEVFFAQSELDAARLRSIGVEKAHIRVMCNLKYAVSAPQTDAASIRKRLDISGQRPILLAASTHEDEEATLLNMLPSWQKVRPDLLMVLVPRHPQRFDEVASLVTRLGFHLARWSEKNVAPDTDVVLVDAMGVLRELYTVADLVFIGGSLVPVGGHNPLEAAVCGRGVVTGPYVHNFRDIIEDMKRESVVLVARDADDVNRLFQDLLSRPQDLQTMNGKAALFMQGRRKVLPSIMSAIEPYLACK